MARNTTLKNDGGGPAAPLWKYHGSKPEQVRNSGGVGLIRAGWHPSGLVLVVWELPQAPSFPLQLLRDSLQVGKNNKIAP